MLFRSDDCAIRQTNTFFPDDPYHNALKLRMAAETNSFIKALRNFLRGPTDDETLRDELYVYVNQGLMTPEQADATMAASSSFRSTATSSPLASSGKEAGLELDASSAAALAARASASSSASSAVQEECCIL